MRKRNVERGKARKRGKTEGIRGETRRGVGCRERHQAER